MAILMAGQLVIPDAGDACEDGGKLRFSRQSLGLLAWRSLEDIHRLEKLEGTRSSLLLPAYTLLENSLKN